MHVARRKSDHQEGGLLSRVGLDELNDDTTLYLEKSLDKRMQVLKDSPRPNPRDMAEAPDCGGAPEVEQLFLEAGRAETFGLRGKVGGWWTAAIKKDPELRAKYAALGRQYQEQRAFRQQRALAQAHLCKTKRVATKSAAQLDKKVGAYEPLERVAQLEGAGPAGNLAAKRDGEKSMNMFKQSITFYGKQIIEPNNMIGRWECLYMKKRSGLRGSGVGQKSPRRTAHRRSPSRRRTRTRRPRN